MSLESIQSHANNKERIRSRGYREKLLIESDAGIDFADRSCKQLVETQTRMVQDGPGKAERVSGTYLVLYLVRRSCLKLKARELERKVRQRVGLLGRKKVTNGSR